MILALQTAVYTGASVALVRGSACVARRSFAAPRSLTAALVPAILELLHTAGAAPSDIELIAADCGPGSFTGIRIGIAVAQGLAAAWRAPAGGIAHFDLYTCDHDGDSENLVVIDARASDGVHYQRTAANGVCQRGFATRADLEKIATLTPGSRGVAYGDTCQDALRALGWIVNDNLVAVDACAVGVLAGLQRSNDTLQSLAPLYCHPTNYVHASVTD